MPTASEALNVNQTSTESHDIPQVVFRNGVGYCIVDNLAASPRSSQRPQGVPCRLECEADDAHCLAGIIGESHHLQLLRPLGLSGIIYASRAVSVNLLHWDVCSPALMLSRSISSQPAFITASPPSCEAHHLQQAFLKPRVHPGPRHQPLALPPGSPAVHHLHLTPQLLQQ